MGYADFSFPGWLNGLKNTKFVFLTCGFKNYLSSILRIILKQN